MLSVTISEKGGQQSQREFDESEITIGRMKGNDIVLAKGNVSKKHAQITAANKKLFITDLNSTNGTYVNGRKVTGEQPIGDEDKVYIGDFILQVELPGAANAGPPQPPKASPGQSAPAGSPNPSSAGAPSGLSPGDPPPSPPPGGDQPNSNFGGGGPVDDLFAASNAQSSTDSRNDGSRRQRQSTGGADAGGDFDLDDLGISDGRSTDSGRRRSQSGSQRSSRAQNPAAGAPPKGESPPRSRRNSSAGPAANRRDSSAGQPGSPGRSGRPDTTPPGRRNRGSAANAEPPRDSNSGQPALRRTGEANARRSASSRQPAAERAADQSRSPRPSDRAGGRLGGRPAHGSRPNTNVAEAAELGSNFDADFHAAQHDVARVLFESVDCAQLPLDYPPSSAQQKKRRRQVDDAVNTVNPAGDSQALAELLTAECVGLGPVETYLDDPAVQDIYVNRFDQILVRRDGEMVVAERAFSHPDLLTLTAHRLLGSRDETIGADEVRFGDGTRVHVVMPPASVSGPALTIRKPPTNHPSLEQLEAANVLSAGMREFLDRAVQAGRSFVVAGPTSSGKSTMLGALAKNIPESTRVVTVEEATHLDLPQPTAVRLEAHPAAGYDMKYLVRTAVAMHPQRILVDECRGGEAHDWVTSAASGTEGSMMTAHGTGPSDALGRLESLCLLASPDISPRGLREQIARAVDFVIVVHRSSDNNFRVRQITEVQGVDLDAFRLNDVFYYRVEENDEQFHPTGYIPVFYEVLRHAGVEVDFDIFRD